MVREIKFRAWDNINKMSKTFTFSDIESDGGYGSLYNPKIFTDTTSEIVVHELLDKDKYILMQFTGLYDKNGKEIYEGDVLCIDDEELEGYGDIFKCPNLNPEEFENFGEFRDSEFEENKNQYSHIKIIGNIYQNPELVGEYK